LHDICLSEKTEFSYFPGYVSRTFLLYITSREKPTAGAPNLLTASELQLASDTNAGGNALSLAHFIFAGEFAMRQE
jgi:hypothetical protein